MRVKNFRRPVLAQLDAIQQEIERVERRIERTENSLLTLRSEINELKLEVAALNRWRKNNLSVDAALLEAAGVFAGALLGLGLPRAIGYPLAFIGFALILIATVTAKYQNVLRVYHDQNVEDVHKIKRLIGKHKKSR